MRTIIIIWADGSEEEVLCGDWHFDKNGVLVICLNQITREYRYIVRECIREVKIKS